MIAQAVERVWSGGSSGTPGQDYAVAPLLLPPYPSQYCFPEHRQIKINLNSSTESDTSGNACGALNYMFRALCMLCTLVTKYLCIYLFLQWGNNQHNSHRYPVASNGKLLDVAVIGESAQSTQVSTQKPQSDSDVEVLGVTKQTQHTRKVMGKDRGLLECPKCSSRHASDPRWVYCPKCFVVIHKTCLLISGCICKYRLTQ